MDITIHPHHLSGTVAAVSSKSVTHRHLICSAFSDRNTQIICRTVSQDIESTVECLQAIGAKINRTEYGFLVQPVTTFPSHAELYCRESGSTLRFMLPICGALGIHAKFFCEGRLSERPLSPLTEEMERMGCCILKNDDIQCSGMLHAGDYHIKGNVSSQFISGLMLALSLLPTSSTLSVDGNLESAPYVKMTQDILSLYHVNITGKNIPGSFPFHSPGRVIIENDWSNAAFFLSANFLGNSVSVKNLAKNSVQGDRIITKILSDASKFFTLSASDIPDLIPVLSVVAASSKGAKFTDIKRLRYKESDRVKSIEDMLHSLGCETESTENTLIVHPGKFSSGTVNSAHDHRIAMAAAIAATAAAGPVTIQDADCVNKSYPQFWDDFKALGGKYEQSIRQ